MKRTNQELYKFMTHLLDCSCVFCVDMRKDLGLPENRQGMDIKI